MAIESWIDEIVRVAGSVASHEKGRVRAFKVAGRGEIPESLSPGMFPCVLVYPLGVRMLISASMSVEIWTGVMEYYLFPDTKKTNIPAVVRYYSRIRNAVASNLTLGGLVDHFIFAPDDTAMDFATLDYGDLVNRHGIMVRWQVKSNISAEVSLSG